MNALENGSLFVGIDVAKDKLDLARSDVATVLTVENNSSGIAQVVELLRNLKPTTIVVEATGGWERPLLAALLEASLPGALVNPAKVRHFAQALGCSAKTDALDAQVLVEFARAAAPRLAEKRSESLEELEALVTCRRQLIHIQTEQRNRRHRTTSKRALQALDAVLDTIQRQIAQLDEQIEQLIQADAQFTAANQLLRSVPGVGPTLSATLLAELRELGTTDRRQIGALVGVAPFNHDSGRLKGQRAIRGGRAEVRSVLYMATVCAMRFNPIIKAFAQRLRNTGKRTKVVIVACMRKLLALLNAMLRDQLPWNQLTIVKKLDN